MMQLRCDDLRVQYEADLKQLSDFWSDIRGTAEGVELEAELAREVTAGHALAGVAVVAVAVRKLRKEVLYLLSDGRWAWVHLTWRPEIGPRQPSARFADSWAALIEELRDGDRA